MRELVKRLRLRMYGMTTGADVICTLYFRQLSVLYVQLLPAPRAALLLLAVLLPSYVVAPLRCFVALLYVLCKSRVQLSS